MNEPLIKPAPTADLQRLIAATLDFELASHRLVGDVGEIGEQWAAHHLGALLRQNKTRAGWDLYHSTLGRVQVRTRMPDIEGGLPTRVNLTGDFDHLVFVYLNREYQVEFLQLLTTEETKALGGAKQNCSPEEILAVGHRIVGQGLTWPKQLRGQKK